MLNLENVSVTFRGRRAVSDVTLKVSPGITFLLGRNGAGKTTLCRVVGGDDIPFTGDARVRDASLHDRASRRDYLGQVGWMPQFFECPASMCVDQIVEYAAWLKGMKSSRMRAAARSVLAEVDLADRSGSRYGALSGGMKRRVALACAIVHEPKVLILDEPTVSLDPEQRDAFHENVRSLATAERCVLFSTHLMEDVAALRGDIQVLDQGHLITERFVMPQGEVNSESLRVAFLRSLEGSS